MAMAAGVAAMPLLLLHQPAQAAETVDVESGSLDFLTFDGRPVSCQGTVDAAHNTDNPDQPLLTWSTDSTAGSDCGAFFHIIATYKDENGTTRSVRYTAPATSFGGVDGAYSPTTVTLEIDYTQCDPEQSATCTLTLTASPK
jgi:hypothetical protein